MAVGNPRTKAENDRVMAAQFEQIGRALVELVSCFSTFSSLPGGPVPGLISEFGYANDEGPNSDATATWSAAYDANYLHRVMLGDAAAQQQLAAEPTPRDFALHWRKFAGVRSAGLYLPS